MHSTGKEAALGLNIGTSFQIPQSEHAQSRTRIESASDFGAKLGLQSDASSTLHRESATFGERSTQQLVNQSTRTVQVANEQVGMKASALIELYALGLRAGHHLSHVSHAFMADTLQTASMMSVEDSVSIPAGCAPQALAVAALHDAVTTIESMSLTATQSSASSLDIDSSPIVREWAGYLGSQWPERRWQLMKRPDGLELLVRDYHLTHEEQVDLVADLRAHIPSSAQPLERIWLNGQVVWQAESALNQAMTGGHYGR